VSQQDFLPGRSARDAAQRAVDLMAVLANSCEVEQVAAILEAHGETDLSDLSAHAVEEMREAAPALRAVFAAADISEAASLLNDLLARYAHPPRLTTHGGTSGWHLHVDGHDDGPWGAWLLTSTCLALAVLLADRQALPGGLCASPSCGKPFVDLGGGSPQRYCTPRCATRERVAAHRRAKRAHPMQ
jgi:predicted RNA-binding Zn ribbon-like protein